MAKEGDGQESLSQVECLVLPLVCVIMQTSHSKRKQIVTLGRSLLPLSFIASAFKKNFFFFGYMTKWGMQRSEATARELYNSEASKRVDGVT